MNLYTHDGTSHPDELIACALYIAKHPGAYVIRDRSAEKGMGVLVDMGREYSPKEHVLDHHQDPDLPCSFVLMAEYLGLDTALLSDVYPWWDALDVRDRKGICAAKDNIVGLANPPVGSMLMSLFSDEYIIRQGHKLHLWLRVIGERIISEAERIQRKVEEVQEKGIRHTLHVGPEGVQSSSYPGSTEVVVLESPVPGEPTVYSQLKHFDFSITPKTQVKEQWNIYRSGICSVDSDLSWMEDLDGCTFAHSEGFFAAFDTYEAAQAAIIEELHLV